jgi:alpha-beta hydrolase superfamily lysophospholipase
VSSWTTDVLGKPYEARTLELGTDDEGPVQATLVRRRAGRATDRAVLYVHGFVDYFFQTHVADFWVERGYDVYALDLRKYGRSLRDGQTAYFCRSLSEYFGDIDAAASVVRAEDGHDVMLVDAHSTGGLISALWAHRVRGRGVVQALLLNSPFFDLNANWLLRTVATDVASAYGARRPYRIIPLSFPLLYGRSLHGDHDGEWNYDLAWKPLESAPLRAGWLRAIRQAQRRLHAGLDVDCPVLVQCSTASATPSSWDEVVHSTDIVLDVEQIARWAPQLGPLVTINRVTGGMHDLSLSAKPAREQFFADRVRWLAAYA